MSCLSPRPEMCEEDCCDIPLNLNMINRILILLRYIFFFEISPANNFKVKHVCPGAISEWMIDREVFLGVHK
jgi:hypothetical protein